MLESIFIASSELTSIKGHSHSDVVMVLPYVDHELCVRLEEVLRVRAKHPGSIIFVNDDKRLGFMMVANLVYAWTSSPYFGYLAQDAFPGEQWLKQGLESLRKSGAGLLAFNDGRYFGTVAVFGLADRAWLKTLYNSTIFHPGYQSHFGDTELTYIAYRQQALVFNPNCLLVEVDYEKHKRGINPKDQELYNQRARTGFDGLIPPFNPSNNRIPPLTR